VKNYSYGYIGSEDLTMYPILPPGSFIQVDESRNKVLIYFIGTREGYICTWCTESGEELILLPHPLSPVAPKTIRVQQADITGQGIGAAMRLGDSLKEDGDAEDYET
jgi:hypothetical protein